MQRKSIKIEYNNYILEELIINKKVLFYKKDNTSINNSKDIEILTYLYQKYILKKIYFKDTIVINDIFFKYTENKVIINLLSFKNKYRHLSKQ